MIYGYTIISEKEIGNYQNLNMTDFKLNTDFNLLVDQPEAIRKLTRGHKKEG